MVYFVRSVKAKGARLSEAFKWALKISEFLKSKYPGTISEVLVNVTGPQDEIHWMTVLESVGQFEQRFQELLGDETYMKLMAEGEDLIEEGSVIDNYYRTLPGLYL